MANRVAFQEATHSLCNHSVLEPLCLTTTPLSRYSLPSASFAPPLPSDDFELRQQTVRLLVLPAYLHFGFLLASVRRHLDLHEALCTVIGRLLRVRRVHRVRLTREGR